MNNVLKVLKQNGVNVFELGSDALRDFDFIKQLYIEEEYPIFEHSPYHALSYLLFESNLYAIEGIFGRAILVVRGDKWFLFTPRINDSDKFENLLLALKSTAPDGIEIQNVSNQWTGRIDEYFVNGLRKNLKVVPRSREESVYDVDMLNRMEGKHFANLRQFRNKLIDRGIVNFEVMDKSNIKEAYQVLTTWQNVQGIKYQKNKFEKEKFVISKFSEFSAKNDVVGVIGRVDGKPLSIGIMHRVPERNDWGVIYMVKGINRTSEGGVHGISDATYIYLFSKAQEMGIKYLNDGELGTEEGTRNHKLYFKPIQYLKSFDLFVN